MKILRYILFTLVCFFFISIIYPVSANIFYWLLSYKSTWAGALIFFYAVTITGVLFSIVYLLTTMIIKISPSYKYAFYVVCISLVYLILNEVFKIYFLDVEYKGVVLRAAILLKALQFFLSIAVFIPAYVMKEEFQL